MSSIEIARKAAAALNLLDPSGELVALDSLTTVEYVVALETEIGGDLPSTASSHFSSLAAVGDLLDRVRNSS